MNAKHTPGPWQVNRKYKMSVEACADGQGINIIADCLDPDGFRTAGEDQANARLISAAPDLLAALEAVTLAIEQLVDIRPASPVAFSVRKARAAIAKAKGE